MLVWEQGEDIGDWKVNLQDPSVNILEGLSKISQNLDGRQSF
jgi:hypothetical protein